MKVLLIRRDVKHKATVLLLVYLFYLYTKFVGMTKHKYKSHIEQENIE